MDFAARRRLRSVFHNVCYRSRASQTEAWATAAAVTPVEIAQSISRSDQADLNDKDRLKLSNLERFLFDLMISSNQKSL
ncbi:hypothetical protein SAMN02745172_03189 [Pseudoxanthobacter soli DSM 19599]|uniref:Uncharacterized protein n=1 Tax=Pseudoxanthobacter soli DSM 19599 TaxID=1123029 RepID=A0A1M7ZNN5_9HYPH|nr:hypothetical protein [Pseudoxanthobacter soli]SHO66530.1 hypothetical protein SAMN02745172_03189 [Pseudoxanthobacter soli DSM 19599]